MIWVLEYIENARNIITIFRSILCTCGQPRPDDTSKGLTLEQNHSIDGKLLQYSSEIHSLIKNSFILL